MADDLADAVPDDDDALDGRRRFAIRSPRRPASGLRTPEAELRAARTAEPADKLPGFEALEPETPSGYGEITWVDRNQRTGAAKIVATSSSAHRFPWGEERNNESITYEAADPSPEKPP